MEQLLAQKIKLSDGSKAHVFSKLSTQQQQNNLKVIKPSEVFINCHLCRVGKLPECNVITHARGKRHLKNLQTVQNAENFRKPLTEKETSKFCEL
jgi:hypothetical protein